jgi:GT2 family glycosyltransferase
MVSIVSVNYDQPIVTCEMLASLRKVTYLILKIVVDNAS